MIIYNGKEISYEKETKQMQDIEKHLEVFLKLIFPKKEVSIND